MMTKIYNPVSALERKSPPASFEMQGGKRTGRKVAYLPATLAAWVPAILPEVKVQD